MSVVPPFDIIPKIPIDAITEVNKKLDQSVNRLIEDTTRFVKTVTKLPKNCSCDDPRVTQAKNQLADIQKQITAIQNSVPKIQSIVDKIKTAVRIAQVARTAIVAAQLLNPVTAGVFLAQQTMLIQEQVIVNAIGGLSIFSTVPISMSSKLAAIVPLLIQSIDSIGQACNGDVSPLDVNKSVIENVNSAIISNTDDSFLTDNDAKWNAELPTEFYTDYNVAESDISDRGSLIESYSNQLSTLDSELDRIILLQQSIVEAPTQVLRGNGKPKDDIGKLGDYYIDESDNNKIYGPKTADTWVYIT